jgi:hypothetical protein
MIFTDSRYATGRAFKAHDSRSNSYGVAVMRSFPVQKSKFYHYTWVEKDRIDILAEEFLGSPDLWWVIMDFNPELIDPFDIAVGTVLRIPSA